MHEIGRSTSTVDELVARVREALAAASDPVRAAGAQRYLKSAMPLYGLSLPALRRTVRPLIVAHPLPDRAAWERAVRALFDGATHREERYAALELAGHRLYRAHRDAAAMDLWGHLIVCGAWWDLVDPTVSLVADSARADPDAVRATLWSWATADDLWLRRVAILSQLGAKGGTDRALLTHAIDANLDDSRFGTEFFVRKAIGWALRQHAYTDADWVRAFVAERGARLSGLSRREALKHVGPAG